MTEQQATQTPGSLDHEATLKHMLKLAGPMVVTHVSVTVMQFVDRFMVSRLGTEALAAILPATLFAFVPASFLLGIMTSVNTFVSQSLGRRRYADCSNYCWQAINMGLVYSVITLVVLWPSAGWIFRMLGHPETVVRLETTYFRIMLFCQFTAVFVWSCTQFFMGIHRPIITMYAAIVAQVVNVLFNYILIFGKFGFPQLGIAGAGWGTFIGISVGVAIRLSVFLTGDVNRKFKSRKSFGVDLPRILDLVRIGLPAGIALTVGVAIWGTILFALVGRFGEEPMAATSAVLSCTNVSFMPIVGISTALTAAVGKSIGAGRKDLAVRQVGLCVKIALCYMGFIGACFFIFRTPIMKFWAPLDDKVVAVGANILMIAAVFQLFDALVIIYTGALRGAGDTVWLAGTSAFAAALILGLGGFLVVTFLPQLGAIGPWFAALAEIIFLGLAHRWRFNSNRWMRIDLFKRRGGEIPPPEIGQIAE